MAEAGLKALVANSPSELLSVSTQDLDLDGEFSQSRCAGHAKEQDAISSSS
jgi:hypothetical protein